MKPFTRESLQQTVDRKREKVDTSAWTPGEESYVWVQELSAAERDQLEIENVRANTGKGKRDKIGFRTRIAIASCVDDERKRPTEFVKKQMGTFQRVRCAQIL